MTETTKIYPSGMVRDLETGGFNIPISKEDKKLMTKKKVTGMAADFLGYFCIYLKTSKSKRAIEQKGRFKSPREAIDALKSK